jgi:hypothetical protein
MIAPKKIDKSLYCCRRWVRPVVVGGYNQFFIEETFDFKKLLFFAFPLEAFKEDVDC